MSFPSQEFVENSKKMGQYKPDDGDGREMKSMVSWKIFVVCFSPAGKQTQNILGLCLLPHVNKLATMCV